MAYRVQRGAYSKTSVERTAFSVELSKEKGKRQKIEDKLVYNMQHIAKNVKKEKGYIACALIATFPLLSFPRKRESRERATI